VDINVSYDEYELNTNSRDQEKENEAVTNNENAQYI
jgi:hypothetical protein